MYLFKRVGRGRWGRGRWGGREGWIGKAEGGGRREGEEEEEEEERNMSKISYESVKIYKNKQRKNELGWDESSKKGR